MIGEDHDDIPSDHSRVRDLNDQSGEESYLGISGNSRSDPSINPKSKVIG